MDITSIEFKKLRDELLGVRQDEMKERMEAMVLSGRQREMKDRMERKTKNRVVVEKPDLTITREWIGMMAQPLVYLFIKGKRVLYAGSSKHGLVRVITPSHHARKARKQATEVAIYFCDTHRQALDLERAFIHACAPPFNSILFGGQRTTQWQRDRGMR